MNVQKITPCLWFDGNGEEAAKYYIGIFKNSKILSAHPIMTVLELDGLKLMILNGGPKYKLDEAFSLSIPCDTQEEIDYYWDTLTADGGEESRCGWCRDKYGVSWQVVPSMLGQLMSQPGKGQKVMSALLEMKKLDIAKLQGA
jgi:predicted 3-demethylubiquinone-9 3-methyltransferase (glyoxalase superfamily)